MLSARSKLREAKAPNGKGTLRSGDVAKLDYGNGDQKSDEDISIAINESVVDRVLKDRRSFADT